jgi:hypothetical protein
MPKLVLHLEEDNLHKIDFSKPFNSEGQTCLHVLCNENFVEMLRALVRKAKGYLDLNCLDS